MSTHPELGENTDRVPAAVLNERAGDDLHRVRNGAEWPALDAGDAASLGVQADADRHLGRATSRREDRVEEDVAGDGHGVCEVAVDFVEDVLGRPTEEDGARLGFLTLSEEREVLVADLLNVEEAALRADICLTQIFDAINDCRANGARETVVVCFANAAKGGDVRLVEEVLGVICTRNTT